MCAIIEKLSMQIMVQRLQNHKNFSSEMYKGIQDDVYFIYEGGIARKKVEYFEKLYEMCFLLHTAVQYLVLKFIAKL